MESFLVNVYIYAMIIECILVILVCLIIYLSLRYDKIKFTPTPTPLVKLTVNWSPLNYYPSTNDIPTHASGLTTAGLQSFNTTQPVIRTFVSSGKKDGIMYETEPYFNPMTQLALLVNINGSQSFGTYIPLSNGTFPSNLKNYPTFCNVNLGSRDFVLSGCGGLALGAVDSSILIEYVGSFWNCNNNSCTAPTLPTDFNIPSPGGPTITTVDDNGNPTTNTVTSMPGGISVFPNNNMFGTYLALAIM